MILLFVFGAKRLPEIGASLGKGIRTFKSSVTGEDEKNDNSRKDIIETINKNLMKLKNKED